VLLTALLKRDGFAWNDEAVASFAMLKTAIATTLMLGMPDFAKPFIVECDMSS
jgi:hypothetical protein